MGGKTGKSGGRRPCKECGQGHGNWKGGLCSVCFKSKPPEPPQPVKAPPDPTGERLGAWLEQYGKERGWKWEGDDSVVG
jgi:hypothetical protein